MAKIYGYYEYNDSLTPGQSEDGGLSQLLFDSEGKLSDHATFHPRKRDDDEDYTYDATTPPADSDPEADAQAAALLILAVIGAAAGSYVLIRKATPHVQRMINERTLPAVRSFWNKVRGQAHEITATPTNGGDLATMPRPADSRGDDAAPGTDAAVAKPQMSADEWYARFRAMFEARQFADQQWTLLAAVQVADDDAIRELQREMERNQPEAVVHQATLMLEAATQADDIAEAQPLGSRLSATLNNSSEPSAYGHGSRIAVACSTDRMARALQVPAECSVASENGPVERDSVRTSEG